MFRAAPDTRGYFSLSLSTIGSRLCIHLAYWNLQGQSRQSIILWRNGGRLEPNFWHAVHHSLSHLPPVRFFNPFMTKGWMIPPRISVRGRYTENDKVVYVDEKGPFSFLAWPLLTLWLSTARVQEGYVISRLSRQSKGVLPTHFWSSAELDGCEIWFMSELRT